MESPVAQQVGQNMSEAAATWLDLLDDAQRPLAEAKVPRGDPGDADEAARRRWFYTPTDHGGLTLTRQSPGQQQAAMRLVASGLSEAGYVTVATILGIENILDRQEGFRPLPERHRDPGRYYVRVFGRPAAKGTWGWRFGGHHVSLNYLVVDGEVVATTPQFFGSNPASSPLLGGAVLRPLSQVEELARELVRSLRGEASERAVVGRHAPDEIITGNTPVLAASDLPPPDGVSGAELDADQRGVLCELLATYFGRVPPDLSPLGSYEDASLSALRFAWAGPTDPGAPHYYRVQGPGLLLEWDNTQDGANHGHSVWRDPDRDFGHDVLAEHRSLHHS